ncbi:MAG: carboxypeptidase M32 [Luteolibacter sp.]
MRIFELARNLGVVKSIGSVIGWDQETGLPQAAASHRAMQIAWISARAHEIKTSDNWRKALEEAEAANDGTNPGESANLHQLRRDFDRDSCLPVELVARNSKATSLAKHAWADARKRSNFSSFAPHLQTLIELAREKADLWGYQEEPYDALLENYERATTTAAVSELFDKLEPQLRRIASEAVEKSNIKSPSLPPGPYPIHAQQQLNARIAESLGFDFSKGRIDTTTHPFCATLGPSDVRLTTRYDEQDFTSSLFGVLHETGHGLYELGLPDADFGLPSGEAVSLGIHESQSRLWENHIGRADAFWYRWYPEACALFPQLAGFPLDKFLSYIRRAAFSPIRVEADEATYDLHILLRFDLERRMLRRELAAEDVPTAWNEGFRHLFGFTPADDRHGCLQDIHWSMGGLGYFATYSLGNLNAAQLFQAANQDPAIAVSCDKADYEPLLQWMRKNIHAHGATLDPADLMRQATGKSPSADAYLSHLSSRYL